MDVEDAPPSKVPRVERKIKITDIKLHSRLNIYDFVGYDISLPGYDFCDLSFEPEDADDTFKKYARIGQAAAAFGDLETIQYLSKIEDNPLSLNRVSDEHKGKLEDISIILLLTRNWKGLKWTIEKGYDQSSLARYGIDSAISVGANMDILKWLHLQGWLLDEFTFSEAATRGDMEIIKWLHEEQCPWDFATFENALRHENLAILKWLKKEGCPWHERVFHEAATIGNLHVLLWLRYEGCPWDSCTFSAAVNGRADLVTLKWLHNEKCPWDKYVFTAAVKRGDLEILRWLREKQCPWDAECYRAAVEKKNGDVLEWLHREKCPWNEETRNIMIRNLQTCFKKHQHN